MLHRAIKDDRGITDFYRIQQQYVVGLTKAVVAGNRKTGVLLLTLDSTWLSEQLANLHSEVIASGSAELLYQLQNAEPTSIAGDTLNTGATAIQASSTLSVNPAVSVRYHVGETVAMSSSLLLYIACLLYTSPSPRDRIRSRMPSSA